jgi:hypothetical protein
MLTQDSGQRQDKPYDAKLNDAGKKPIILRVYNKLV